MTHIESVVVPGGAPVPKVRHKIPDAFARPRIDLDAGRIKREWKRIPVCNVAEGDIVPDIGVVETVNHHFSVESDEPYVVDLLGGEGRSGRFPGTAEILVFAPEDAR